MHSALIITNKNVDKFSVEINFEELNTWKAVVPNCGLYIIS